MAIHATRQHAHLKAAFDALIDRPPEQWSAAIRTAELSSEDRSLLHAMLAFDRLLGLQTEERHADVLQLDLPDDVLKRLMAMLGADEELPALLRGAVAEALQRFETGDGGDPLEQSLVGSTVGSFRLTGLLGHGGSSLVFRAERGSGSGSQVAALKLLRAGLFSTEAQRRFRREQAILAQLTHPNIARLIEGGVSAQGIPYIAMELVEGLPITAAADAQGLGIERRLHLFARLCRTIEAAHAQLVVHRDIKPSNIFVTHSGELKVLDFGIARLVEDEPVTHTRAVMLTPEYAAPEQFLGGPLTTAVDIYALGMVLGELLTGARLSSSGRASAQLSGRRETATPLPRGLPARQALSRRLAGDLDAILSTALAEEPSRRYPSAAAFAEDIERYLAGAPVRAHPPSRLYRLRKFVVRHRAGIAAATAFVLALSAGLATTTWQARVARAQAGVARNQAHRAEAVRDLLASIFELESADLPKDRRPSMEDVVAGATGQLMRQDSLPDDVRADLLLTLAKVTRSIGLDERAETLLTVAEPLIERAYGSGSDERLDARILHAEVMDDRADIGSAISLLEPRVGQFLSMRDSLAVRGLRVLGGSLLHGGQIDAGLARLHDAVDIATGNPRNASDVLPALIDESSALIDAQRFDDGMRKAQDALDEWQRQGEPSSRAIIDLYSDMAVALESAGRLDEAEVAYRRAIALGERFFDGANPATAWNIGLLGTFLIAQGRVDEAEYYVKRALQMRTQVFGPHHPRTLYAIAGMGKLSAARGDAEAAVRWYTQGIDTCGSNALREELVCIRLYALRASARAQNGNLDGAETDIHQALSMQEKFSGDDNPSFAYVLHHLLRVQIARREFGAALASADRILAIDREAKAGLMLTRLETRALRAQALYALGRNDEALAEIADVEPRYSALAPLGAQRFAMLSLTGRALAKANRPDDARRVARAALGLDRPGGRRDARVVRELERIAKA